MKKLFFILFTICLVSINATAVAETTASPLDLSGSTGSPQKGPSRTKSVGPTVTASQDQSYIYLDFYRSVGDVTISIYDSTGQKVYQTVVISGYGVTELIDTTCFDAGIYRIVLTNTSGMNLEGYFVL